MEVNKDIKNTPVIMEWLGEERGDNLAIKSLITSIISLAILDVINAFI